MADRSRQDRDRLYREICRRLAIRPDSKVRRHWGAVLRLATGRDRPVQATVPAS